MECGAVLLNFQPNGSALRIDRAANPHHTARHLVRYISNISCALIRFGQKVKYRTVMPDIVGGVAQFRARDIGYEPLDLFRSQTQPLLGHVNSDSRNIEDGDVLVAACKEVINEGGFASPNVNNERRISGSSALYQSK